MSKSDLAYTEIRRMIIDGSMEAGSRLVTDRLARKLAMSVVPVREALFRLEAEGFVESTFNSGFRITPVDSGSIHDLFGLLEALEVLSVQAACRTMSDEGLLELHRFVDHMDAVDDDAAWTALNREFHELISRRSSTPLVTSALRLALDHWERLRRSRFRHVDVTRTSVTSDEHRALLRAISHRDPHWAGVVVSAHNRAALASYVTSDATTSSTMASGAAR